LLAALERAGLAQVVEREHECVLVSGGVHAAIVLFRAMAPRVALVTGGAGGIGGAIVRALTSAGHRVGAGDIADEAVAEAALAVRLDVTDSGSVESAVARVERELGPIEILVNTAGWDEFHPFVDTDEAFWDRIIDLNYKGCLRVCRRVVPGMVEREYGRVVNISSDAARVGSSLEAVYAGAKAAQVAFGKTLAREVARRGVTVNSVCPGPTETPLLEGLLGAGEDSAKMVDALRRAVPMRRLGRPDDVAAAVAFLVSEEAGYITGQTLSVSGGLTMV
jgi:2-hydroxycyclohexanecarboxyl-CoA dehydrogenase